MVLEACKKGPTFIFSTAGAHLVLTDRIKCTSQRCTISFFFSCISTEIEQGAFNTTHFSIGPISQPLHFPVLECFFVRYPEKHISWVLLKYDHCLEGALLNALQTKQRNETTVCLNAFLLLNSTCQVIQPISIIYSRSTQKRSTLHNTAPNFLLQETKYNKTLLIHSHRSREKSSN